MDNIGLRSYQDIEEPEYVEPQPTAHEMKELFRSNAVELFQEVLEAQEETGEHIWFDYVPDEVMVYTTVEGAWHNSRPIEMIVDVDLDDLTPKTFDDEIVRMFADLGNWVDKTMEKKERENG